jgi:hypothetical protein
MTDTSPNLHDAIKALHSHAETVWQDARRIEAAAWDTYRGDGNLPRQSWAEARELASLLGSVVGMIERVQRVTASKANRVSVEAER